MKEENIKKTGKIVIGLTAAASTIASVVGYYYASQACVNHFVYNNETRTAKYFEKVDIAACYFFSFIILPPVTVILTTYISFKIFFGLSSDITKPFDNTNHGLAKCLKDNDDPSNNPNDDNSMPHPQFESSDSSIQPSAISDLERPQVDTDQRFMLPARDDRRPINDSLDEPQTEAAPAQPAGTMEPDAQTHNDQEPSMIDEEMVQLQIDEPQPEAAPAQPAGAGIMEPAALTPQPAYHADDLAY